MEMQKKTEERLEREFLVLPLHHIDTDVITESAKGTKLGDICLDYLNRVGYKYRGTLSLPVLGEFLLITIRDNETVEKKELAVKSLDTLIQKRKIKFFTPLKSTYLTAYEVMNSDTRIEPTDAINYAMAVQENADTFVSFDEKLLDNPTLENVFGVKVLHPKDL